MNRLRPLEMDVGAGNGAQHFLRADDTLRQFEAGAGGQIKRPAHRPANREPRTAEKTPRPICASVLLESIFICCFNILA